MCLLENTLARTMMWRNLFVTGCTSLRLFKRFPHRPHGISRRQPLFQAVYAGTLWRPTGAFLGVCFIDDAPYAKREQRFLAKGGRKPKSAGGERGQGRAAGRGHVCTSEALGARKMGRCPDERRRVSLTTRGIHPLFLRQGAGGASSVRQDRSEA